MISKTIFVFVGCNGSGKSTLIKNFLQNPSFQDFPYLCPDELVKLLPDTGDEYQNYVNAMNKAKNIRENCIKQGRSFIMETVLSTESKLCELQQAKRDGFRICAFACVTAEPAINLRRVQKRVQQGGHNVPPDKVISRYTRSSQNIVALATFADTIEIYDNSIDNVSPVYIANGHHGTITPIQTDQDIKLRTAWREHYLS